MLTSAEELPLADQVAISVYAPTPGGRHTGLIYRDDDGNLHVLHLAFHHDLRDDPMPAGGTCSRVSLAPLSQEIMAAYASRVRRTNPKIPYAVTTEGECFDRDGNYLEGPVGTGLTCATFVTALFSAMRFPMIADETWPKRADDAAWLASIIAIMEQHQNQYGIDQAHIDALKADPVACRIRPEEVAAAAAQPQWPVAFPQIEKLAEEVLQVIQAVHA